MNNQQHHQQQQQSPPIIQTTPIGEIDSNEIFYQKFKDVTEHIKKLEQLLFKNVEAYNNQKQQEKLIINKQNNNSKFAFQLYNKINNEFNFYKVNSQTRQCKDDRSNINYFQCI